MNNPHYTRNIDGGLQAACNYIWDEGKSGNTFRERVQNYLLGIGVTQKGIDDFRTLELE